MMGYPRCDIMQSPAAGDFMAGALTDAVTVGMLICFDLASRRDVGKSERAWFLQLLLV